MKVLELLDKKQELYERLAAEKSEEARQLQLYSYYKEEWGWQGFLSERLKRADFTAFLNGEDEKKQRVSELLLRADQFVSGTYVFQNAWDMERTTIPEYLPLDQLDWSYEPHGDPEWTYMLNRHAFLLEVGIAYQVTGAEKYAQYIRRFIEKFIDENPINEQIKVYSWRTIDAGLRLTNWIRVLEIMLPLDGITPQLFAKIFQSVAEHIDFLKGCLTKERCQSNWTVIEATGLYTGATAFKELAASSSAVTAGIYYLELSLHLQIENDGLQREQSFMYHHEVLLCLLQVIMLADRNQQVIPEILKEKAKAMTQASALFMRPDGTQSNYGDSDIEPMVGLLRIAEDCLQHSYLTTPFRSQPVQLFEQLVTGSTWETDELPTVENEEKQQTAAYFENTGLMVLKSTDQRHYTLFKCGPLGGGHGHDDLLHVELMYNKQAVLCDSGRYSYALAHNRLYFKSATAHNTMVVDNQPFNLHTDAWDTQKTATPVNQRLIEQDGLILTEGGHLGYMDLPDSVFVNRKVLFLDEGIWFICDEVTSQGKHEVCSLFHFSESSIEQLDGQCLKAVQGNEQLSIQTFADGPEGGRFILEACDISPQYNQKYSSRCGVYKREILGNHAQTFVIKAVENLAQIEKMAVWVEGEQLSTAVAEGFKLQYPDGSFKLVLIQHREPSMGRRAYQMDGRWIYGRVAVVLCNRAGQLVKQTVLY